MESNISRTAYAIIGYAARTFLVTLAALFALIALSILICAFIDSDAFLLSVAAAAASAGIAVLCWNIRRDIPVKMEGR